MGPWSGPFVADIRKNGYIVLPMKHSIDYLVDTSMIQLISLRTPLTSPNATLRLVFVSCTAPSSHGVQSMERGRSGFDNFVTRDHRCHRHRGGASARGKGGASHIQPVSRANNQPASPESLDENYCYNHNWRWLILLMAKNCQRLLTTIIVIVMFDN